MVGFTAYTYSLYITEYIENLPQLRVPPFAMLEVLCHSESSFVGDTDCLDNQWCLCSVAGACLRVSCCQ